MNMIPNISRRAFVVGSAAAGSGLAIGFDLPFGPQAARAADGSPEIGVWVVIRPDETVVIRIARSEMGRAPSPALPNWSPKNWNAIGRKSRPNTQRPARALRANAHGAISPPAAAAAFASRISMCARAAPPRARC